MVPRSEINLAWALVFIFVAQPRLLEPYQPRTSIRIRWDVGGHVRGKFVLVCGFCFSSWGF